MAQGTNQLSTFYTTPQVVKYAIAGFATNILTHLDYNFWLMARKEIIGRLAKEAFAIKSGN
jgi:hypothetical protein